MEARKIRKADAVYGIKAIARGADTLDILITGTWYCVEKVDKAFFNPRYKAMPDYDRAHWSPLHAGPTLYRRYYFDSTAKQWASYQL